MNLDNLIPKQVYKPLTYSEEFKPQGLVLATGIRNIYQSIYTLLNTPIGAEFFRPEYGSNIRNNLFEYPSDLTLRIIESDAVDAIEQWERRVNVVDAVATANLNVVTLKISVSLPNETIENLIFEFYINSGI